MFWLSGEMNYYFSLVWEEMRKDLFFPNVMFRSYCLPLLSKTYFFLIIILLESLASAVTSPALTKEILS